MKVKKLLSLGIILALALTIVAPIPVSAAPRLVPFNASATIGEITTGTVSPLHGDWWLVTDRDVIGTMCGSISGDYTLTYRGVFQLQSQAGVLQGSLGVGNCEMNVRAVTQPLELVYVPEYGIELPQLTISGTWVLQEGETGAGTINATAILLIDPFTGHVLAVVSSSVSLQGKWQPRR